MGQEISTEVFTDADRDEYAQRLQQETGLLLQQIADGQFANQPPVAGFEIEGWLVDKNYHPATRCDQLLARLNEPLLTTELAQFNIELNAPPRKLEKTPSLYSNKTCSACSTAQMNRPPASAATCF